MKISQLLPPGRPLLLIAPMQEVTDLAFWRVLHRYGGPDVYFTEYFRVHSSSTPESWILDAIRQNPSGRPVMAQMIGRYAGHLIRTVRLLQKECVAGIDLNIGCPAPVVCKKSAGGGLLRHLEHLHHIIAELRPCISINFTLKTRIGFDTPEEFDRILEVYAQHPVDALTVHGRTVKEMYRSTVHYDRITQAVRTMKCPVFANGNILSAGMAQKVVDQTGAAGLMIGRGAIRNPWIFNQIRELYSGGVQTQPTLLDLRQYIDVLYHETRPEGFSEVLQVAKMKKYMNFIAQGIGPGDGFLHGIRRAAVERDFFRLCDRYLCAGGLFEPEMPGKALVNSGNPRTDCYL